MKFFKDEFGESNPVSNDHQKILNINYPADCQENMNKDKRNFQDPNTVCLFVSGKIVFFMCNFQPNTH